LVPALETLAMKASNEPPEFLQKIREFTPLAVVSNFATNASKLPPKPA
jgi:hypothetical protein